MWEWFLANGIWILVAVVIGLILFLGLRRWAERIIGKTVPEQFREQMEGYRKVVTRIVIGIGSMLIILGITAVIVSTFGIDITSTLKVVGGWLLEHGVRILIIIGIAYLLHRLVKMLTPRLIERSIKVSGRGRKAREELKKREQTLSYVITQVIAVAVAFIAIFMILSEVGIDITAALAGLGIAGIAVGFGAQYLVRDLIRRILCLSGKPV